jgi:hypothetical protein
MSKAKSLSLFGVALAAVVWSSGAMAADRYGYGGGYNLQCRSVSPTYGCSPQQQEINILTFDLDLALDVFGVVNQDVASGLIPLNPGQTEQLIGAETNFVDSIESLLIRL